jgi:hypothetical protein
MKTRRRSEVTHCANCACAAKCARDIEAFEAIAKSLAKMVEQKELVKSG